MAHLAYRWAPSSPRRWRAVAVKPCCTMLCRCWPMPEVGPSSSVAAALRAITSSRPSWTVTGTVSSRPFSSRSSPSRTSPDRPARQQRCHLQHPHRRPRHGRVACLGATERGPPRRGACATGIPQHRSQFDNESITSNWLTIRWASAGQRIPWSRASARSDSVWLG